MLLFEDDADRRLLLRLFKRNLKERAGEVLAWCLMGNHYHLLMRMELELMSEFLRVTNLTYAQRFNARYDRSGHLFKGRFGSQPVASDEQLLCAVRYIHRNPVKAGICAVDEYPWSSYGEYAGLGRPDGTPRLCDPAFVTDVFGSQAAFTRFHEAVDDGGFTFIDNENPTYRRGNMPDSRAIEVGTSILGEGWRETLPQEEREMRNLHLREIRRAGLSINQIERLTGISRGVIQHA